MLIQKQHTNTLVKLFLSLQLGKVYYPPNRIVKYLSTRLDNAKYLSE